MKTDTELLVAVANHYRNLFYSHIHDTYFWHDKYNSGSEFQADAEWNPLKNDGDALRLAIKLKMSISIEGGVTLVSNRHAIFEEQAQDFGGDADAATRRAIVCAAADLP